MVGLRDALPEKAEINKAVARIVLLSFYGYGIYFRL